MLVHTVKKWWMLRAYQIRNHAVAAHRLDGVLCRLRLLLAVDDGHVRDVDLHEVVAARPPSKLSEGFHKRHALHIANSAAKLDDAHIWLLVGVVDGDAGNLLDPFLDGVGDVRDDLDRLAQVVALALALNDVLVDLAGGDVVVAGQGDVEVALVVAEIEIDFAAVGEDEDFAVPARYSVCCGAWRFLTRLGVLLGVHGPRVDIEVGVDLDRGHVRRRSVKPGGIAALALILRPIVLSSRPVEEAVARRECLHARTALALSESYL